jgi:hypothetical protein
VPDERQPLPPDAEKTAVAGGNSFPLLLYIRLPGKAPKAPSDLVLEKLARPVLKLGKSIRQGGKTGDGRQGPDTRVTEGSAHIQQYNLWRDDHGLDHQHQHCFA